MRFKEFARSAIHRLGTSLKRFYIPCAFSALWFLLLCYQIIFENEPSRVFEGLLYSCPLGILAGICASLAAVYFPKQKWLKSFLPVFIYALGVFAGIVVKESFEVYYSMGLAGLCAAMLFAAVYILYLRKEFSPVFGYLFKSAVFAECVGLILLIGLFICLWAFESLIVSFGDSWKVYEILALFCHFIPVVYLFLSYIPDGEEELQLSGIYRIMIYKAAFPVYLLLVSILYVYCAKIILTWNIPSGKINWFASFALLFYVFFYLALFAEQTKPARLFRKYGGFGMLPLVTIQLFAIALRLREYGLTPLRYVSLAFIFIGCVFIVDSILKKSPKYPMAVAAAVILIITITPLNAIDVANRNQSAILKRTLIRNNMYIEGEIIPNAGIPDEDKEKIRSCYDYLISASGKLSEFENKAKDFSRDEFIEHYGFPFYTSQDYTSEDENIENHYYSYSCSYNYLDVREYTKVIPFRIYSRENYSIELAGIEYDLGDYCETLMANYQEDEANNEELKYKIRENEVFYFTLVEIITNDREAYRSFSCEGYLLLR